MVLGAVLDPELPDPELSVGLEGACGCVLVKHLDKPVPAQVERAKQNEGNRNSLSSYDPFPALGYNRKVSLNFSLPGFGANLGSQSKTPG